MNPTCCAGSRRCDYRREHPRKIRRFQEDIDRLYITSRCAYLKLCSAEHNFSAHSSVTVGAEDPEGLERLARYLLRPPLALDRLTLEPGRALYRHKAAAQRHGEPFDPDELLARLIMHIPAPRLHVARYYGFYSHVSRARRRQAGVEGRPALDTISSTEDDVLTSAELKRLRRQWAELLKRIYEVDPLLCSCGAQMRILSFITDPPVVRRVLQYLHCQGIDPPRGPPPPAEPLALVS